MSKVERVCYKAFGLTIASEFDLPELPRFDGEIDTADIQIRFGDLDALWERVTDGVNPITVLKDRIIFRVPDTVTLLMDKGKRIVVSPADGTDEDVVRLYLLGTCMGAILLQRGILPLHGSAVVINDKAYLVIGDSGAGKSTLASAFLSKGFELLTDDVIAVFLSDDGIPHVMPSYPQQKLWKESLLNFGMEVDNYRPIFQRETKFAVPVSGQFQNKPYPIGGVIELVKDDVGQAEIRPVEKLERLHTLFYHTYRKSFVQRMGLLEWHFMTSANIAEHACFFQLKRPASGFTAYQLSELILATINRWGNYDEQDRFAAASN